MKTWDYKAYEEKKAKEFRGDFVRERTLEELRKYAKRELAIKLVGELSELTGFTPTIKEVWEHIEDIGIEIFAGPHPLGAWEGRNIFERLADDKDEEPDDEPPGMRVDDEDIPF